MPLMWIHGAGHGGILYKLRQVDGAGAHGAGIATPRDARTGPTGPTRSRPAAHAEAAAWAQRSSAWLSGSLRTTSDAGRSLRTITPAGPLAASRPLRPRTKALR